MSVPKRDPEQRRAALQKAAETRRVRAELKEMLKAGEVSLRQVLDRAEQADSIAGMRVEDLIGAMPNYGKIRTRRLMEELDIAHGRRLRGLGSNQRENLIHHFESAG